MTKSPAYSNDLQLEVIDLHNSRDVSDLIAQRKLCGWNYSDEVIAKWRDLADRGLKTIFWIVLPQKNNAKAGHISLSSRAEPHDPDLAREDRSVMTISTFFILPEYRSGGLGRHVMDLMEQLAREEPHGSPRCEAIAIDTLSKEYYDEKHPHWSHLRKDLEKQPSNQLWYERRGYVPFKVVPRYKDKIDHEDITWKAVFLRKEL